MSLLLTVPAMADDDGVPTGGTTALPDILNDIDLGSTDSIQFFCSPSSSWPRRSLCKDSANSYIQQIERLQGRI